MAIPRLRFNAKKAFNGYKALINKAADDLINELYTDIKNSLNDAKGDIEKMSEKEENIIRRKIIGYANAVMDSYGTGSEMDTTNPFFAQYKRSNLWNRARYTIAISGRKRGYYLDIYGKWRYSSGKKLAVNIEDYYEPTPPSYAFQRAEAWLTDKKIHDTIDRYTRQWLSNINQYFSYR